MKRLLTFILLLVALHAKAQQQTTELPKEKTDSSVVRHGAYFSRQGIVPHVQIRENPSIPPYTQPLVFINGKEIAYAEVKKIDPDTIESISVLQGKEATFAYGDKAADGVILVRLKKQK